MSKPTKLPFDNISKFLPAPIPWTFDINDVSTPDSARGGLMLKNMFHSGYSFATDLRTIGIWLFPKQPDQYNPVFLVLGPPDFDVISHNVPAATPSSPSFNFSRYQSILQLDVTYESRQHFFGTDQPIKVIQKYLFTDYSSSPAHEPAGAILGWKFGSLTATRVFPMITLQLPEQYDGLIESFRVDYRVHPKIEGFVNKAQNLQNSANYPNGLFDFPNQVGLFLDGLNPVSDTARVVAETAVAAKNVVPGGDTSIAQGAFRAVEKPLVLEVCVTGIKDSEILFKSESQYPNENGQDRYHWDNIHWWGSRGQGNDIISAIGAFHTFHLHWRWGYGAGAALWSEQFQGVKWWGPLVDPRIPTQTVRVAIVRYDAKRDPDFIAHRQLSKENFGDLFDKAERNPQEINQADQNNFEGDNIVLWYSVEAKIPVGFQEGTAFIHGIFFAHENEPNYNPTTGSRTPEYWPKSAADILKEKKWYRSNPPSYWGVY